MPGRLRTASRPLRTWIDSAPYSFFDAPALAAADLAAADLAAPALAGLVLRAGLARGGGLESLEKSTLI